MIKYLAFFCCIFASSVTIAQHLRVGPKLGAQLSRPHYDDVNFYNGYKPRYGLGFHAGGVVNVKASEYFALHTELLYNRVRKHVVGKDGYAVNKDHFNYLTAPLLLRGSLPLGQAEVYLNAGPSVNYWLGGRGFVRHDELDEIQVYDLDHRIAFGEQTGDELTAGVVHVTKPNRIQLGLDMGAGVLIPMNNRYLMVDLRYSWGHTNMAQPDTDYLNLIYYNDNLSFANHSFSLSCAYLYELDLIKLTRKGKSKTIKGKGQ